MELSDTLKCAFMCLAPEQNEHWSTSSEGSTEKNWSIDQVYKSRCHRTLIHVITVTLAFLDENARQDALMLFQCNMKCVRTALSIELWFPRSEDWIVVAEETCCRNRLSSLQMTNHFLVTSCLRAIQREVNHSNNQLTGIKSVKSIKIPNKLRLGVHQAWISVTKYSSKKEVIFIFFCNLGSVTFTQGSSLKQIE